MRARAAIWSLALGLGGLACEHTPPPGRICVTTAAQGGNLRAVAAYYDQQRLHEIIADEPLEEGVACLALRPPRDRRRPESGWHIHMDFSVIGAENRTPAFAAWPIDLAVYDDLNGDGQPQPGELRARSTDYVDLGPTWFIEYEAYLTTWMSFDPARDEVLPVRPFVLTTLSASRDGTEAVRLSEIIASPYPVPDVQRTCDVALYPACVPSTRVLDGEHERLYDPRLSEDDLEYLGVTDPTPMRPVEGRATCTAHRGVITARYFLTEESVMAETCVCAWITRPITIYTLAADPPEWLDCGEGELFIE